MLLQIRCKWPGQEHLQDLEQALETDAREESALHKRAAAVQKAVDDVARMAPEAADAVQHMPGGDVNVQVGALLSAGHKKCNSAF